MRRGPVTGALNTALKTVLPRHDTSFGMPTLTDTSVPARVARSFMDRRLEADPSSDLDGDDRGHHEVHRHAERRPPARGGDEVRPVLPEVLGAVAGQPKHEQPRRAGDGH